jgi:hypothetical protein
MRASPLKRACSLYRCQKGGVGGRAYSGYLLCTLKDLGPKVRVDPSGIGLPSIKDEWFLTMSLYKQRL